METSSGSVGPLLRMSPTEKELCSTVFQEISASQAAVKVHLEVSRFIRKHTVRYKLQTLFHNGIFNWFVSVRGLWGKSPFDFHINTIIRNSVSHYHWLLQFKVFHKTFV